MRNLKRALSLALAAVMLIGMMVVGASAVSYNDFTDRDEIVNKDAVSMLTTLGVIDGKTDGSYDPEGTVRRDEMAKMISVIMNQGVDNNELYSGVDSKLTDIGDNWAKGHINYCFTLGIIAGRGDGRFDPAANVTGAEAAKMLLVAAGYDPSIEGFVGTDWAINTNAKASSLGLFRNFTKNIMLPLSRDDAALLIHNALDVEMIQKYENGYAIGYTDHRTILSAMYGVYKLEGVVTGNKWAQLDGTDSDAALRSGKTNLEEVVLYGSTTASTVTGESKEYVGDLSLSMDTTVEMIGKTVTVYIEKTTILSNSKVLGVSTKDDVNVIKSTTANSDTLAKFLKGTGLAADKDTQYYVNYGYYKTQAAAEAAINEYYDTAKFNLNGISAEVIDNDDDGTVDYVLYLMETLSEVRSYSVKNETISLYSYARDNNGKLTQKADSFSEDFENVVFNDEVATNDVVLYVQYGGRTYISLPEIVTGKMTRVDRDKASELYITVEGETYKQSFIPDAASLVDVDLTHFEIGKANTTPGFDTAYDFILDSTGEYVVAIRPAEETVTNYALVLNSAWTQNALTKSGMVKVLKADGTEATYDINWKASVGSSKAFADDAALESYLGTRDVNQATDNTLGAAIGTVITYTLSDDDVLTIKSVLKTHTLGNDGYVAENGNQAGGEYAYIATNAKSVNDVAKNGPNTDWTLKKTYDSGDASVVLKADGVQNDVTYAIDRNTVAFYYTDSKNYGVAVGWQNMGKVDAANDPAVQVYPVLQKNEAKKLAPTKLAEVILFNANTTASSRDYMFVLNRNAYTASDKLWLNVVFEDGTAKEIEIKDDGGYNFDNKDNSAYKKAYAYVANSDGTYSVVSNSVQNAQTANLLKVGTVNGNVYYALPDSAKVWDVTDMTSASDEPVAGTFTYVDVNAVIIPTTSEGSVIRTAFIWDKDTTTPEKPTDPVYGYTKVSEPTTGTLNIDHYAASLTARQVAALVREHLNDSDIDKVNVPADIKSATVVYKDGTSITYNLTLTRVYAVDLTIVNNSGKSVTVKVDGMTVYNDDVLYLANGQHNVTVEGDSVQVSPTTITVSDANQTPTLTVTNQ